MRVLVTNDDGIEAPGIAGLATALEEAGHTPVVAAPAEDMSGASASKQVPHTPRLALLAITMRARPEPVR
jgi:5'/3'-nucleotidase SurE